MLRCAIRRVCAGLSMVYNGGVESVRSRASGPECREGVCMREERRPLSPHLQISKPQLTSVMSISHRATGVGLAAGTLVLAWWLIAAAAGPEAFATVQGFIGSWFGYLILFGFSYALMYPLCNGIRRSEEHTSELQSL